VDRYITGCNAAIQIASPERAEVEAASALLIYRRLHGAVDSLTQPGGGFALLKPLVLTALDRAADDPITVPQLLATPPVSHLLAQSDDTAAVVPSVLKRLEEEKTVVCTAAGYTLTATGKEAIRNTAAERAKEEDGAFGQFVITFSANAPSASGEERRLASLSFRDALVNAFKARGLAIATAIFAGQSIHPEDLSDIFRVVSDAASVFPAGDLRVAFAIAAHQFILDPTTDQKRYLESVSQGYFLFHLLGLDPTCSQIRADIFQRTLWIVDSSVILPLLAAGCHTHHYATTLFSKLKMMAAHLAVTPKLLREASDHFFWAFMNIPLGDYQNANFISLALIKGSAKQNLFLDGFIGLAADGKVKDFREYMDLIAPDEGRQGSIETAIQRLGLERIELDRLFQGSAEAWAGVVDLTEQVKADRERRAIFRSQFQVDAEAEILFLIVNFRDESIFGSRFRELYDSLYFLSTSRVLDRVDAQHSVRTWTPEALYRYVSSLPESIPDSEMLQQCMLQSYFHAGVSFIDRQRYLQFFGPAIAAAKLSFEQERAAYLKDVENAGTVEESFAVTPELEKPIFVAQMGWKLADEAQKKAEAERLAKEVALARAEAAEAANRQLVAEKGEAWKRRLKRQERQEIATLRNLQDSKHLQKRLRQAKERARKRKK
jgi:hypothetical protein